MLDEQGKGRALIRTLNNIITNKSKFIIMNQDAYTDFCEWAKLYFKKECTPDRFLNVQIVLDLAGSNYMKVVDSASDEYLKRDRF